MSPTHLLPAPNALCSRRLACYLLGLRCGSVLVSFNFTKSTKDYTFSHTKDFPWEYVIRLQENRATLQWASGTTVISVEKLSLISNVKAYREKARHGQRRRDCHLPCTGSLPDAHTGQYLSARLGAHRHSLGVETEGNPGTATGTRAASVLYARPTLLLSPKTGQRWVTLSCTGPGGWLMHRSDQTAQTPHKQTETNGTFWLLLGCIFSLSVFIFFLLEYLFGDIKNILLNILLKNVIGNITFFRKRMLLGTIFI